MNSGEPSTESHYFLACLGRNGKGHLKGKRSDRAETLNLFPVAISMRPQEKEKQCCSSCEKQRARCLSVMTCVNLVEE